MSSNSTGQLLSLGWRRVRPTAGRSAMKSLMAAPMFIGCCHVNPVVDAEIDLTMIGARSFLYRCLVLA
jgi:hypothetical protein